MRPLRLGLPTKVTSIALFTGVTELTRPLVDDNVYREMEGVS